MEFGDIWSYIITIVGSGGITQLVNWRLNKRKNTAEVSAAEAEAKAAEIDNMRKAMQDFYEPLVNRQNTRIEELEKEIKDLRQDKREMELLYQKQIAQLQEQILQITRALGLKSQKEIKVTKGSKNGKV